MSRASRDKGARGEREVIKLLQPLVDEYVELKQLKGIRLQRNTLQSDVGGYDIVGLNGLALEVKNVHVLSIEKWWSQTLRQAGEKVPMLFYKQYRRGWFVRYIDEQSKLIDCSFDDVFKDNFKKYLRILAK